VSATFATAPPVAVGEPASLPAMLLGHATTRPTAVAMRVKELGVWRGITWNEYAGHASNVGLGLLELGAGPGDRVGVLSENRPEWLFADLGIQGIGAVTIGLYATGSEADIAQVLHHSGAKVVIVEDEEQLDKTLAVRDRLPRLEKVVVVDTRGIRSLADPFTMSFDQLEERGVQRARRTPSEWRDRVGELAVSDAAIVVYTSGVVGPPQGVVLSHGNLAAAAAVTTEFYGARSGDEVLSYLPLCHIAERMVSVVAAVRAGYVVNFGEGGESFANDLREVQPTFFLGVPRVWEKLMASVQSRIGYATWLKRWMYKTWHKQGARHAEARMRGDRRGRVSAFLGWLFLYRSLREKLGMARIRIALSGAAPIAPDVLRYFWSFGIPVREVYGQTENTTLATATPARDVRIGAVGRALPGVELRVTDDGEVLVRGPGTFLGYLDDADATRAALDADGWLHTGDLGVSDGDGFLTITGRKTELVITAGGLNISPQRIENLLRVSPFVRDAMVLGDQRPYLTALIGIEFEAVAEWAQQHDLQFTTYEDLATKPEVRRLIEAHVSEVNRELSESEQLRAFEVLPVELAADGHVTATQKVRRQAVTEQFRDLIATMYTAERAS
jgi:long-chain acyl-CoA synthetase